MNFFRGKKQQKQKIPSAADPPAAILSPSLSGVDLWLRLLSSVSWWLLGLAVTLQDSLVSTSIKNFPSDLENHTHTRTRSSAWERLHHVGSSLVFASWLFSSLRSHCSTLWMWLKRRLWERWRRCWLAKQEKRKGGFSDPELMIYSKEVGAPCVLLPVSWAAGTR